MHGDNLRHDFTETYCNAGTYVYVCSAAGNTLVRKLWPVMTSAMSSLAVQCRRATRSRRNPITSPLFHYDRPPSRSRSHSSVTLQGPTVMCRVCRSGPPRRVDVGLSFLPRDGPAICLSVTPDICDEMHEEIEMVFDTTLYCAVVLMGSIVRLTCTKR